MMLITKIRLRYDQPIFWQKGRNYLFCQTLWA